MGGEGSGDKPGHEFHGNQYGGGGRTGRVSSIRKSSPPKIREEVLTFDQYKARKNIPELDHGMIAYPHGASKAQARRISVQASKTFREQMTKTSEAQKEYKALIEAGKVRPPTRLEEIQQRASGHPDNQSVQAARRLLKKMGYEWKE